MRTKQIKRNMYELSDPSKAQRIALAGIAGLWIVGAWWLLLGGGLGIAGDRFGGLGSLTMNFGVHPLL